MGTPWLRLGDRREDASLRLDLEGRLREPAKG